MRLFLLCLLPILTFAQRPSAQRLSPENTFALPSEVAETSGLETWGNKLVTHNDSGNDPSLYVLDTTDFKIVKRYKLPVKNLDWEDIAKDSLYFYLADVGNNYHLRSNLHIFRIEKSALERNEIKLDTIQFQWPERKSGNVKNFNCEAIVSSGDSLFVFTKERNLTRVFSLPKAPGNHIARYKTEFKLRNFFTTGAYFNEFQKRLVLCGYNNRLRTCILDFSGFSGTDFFSTGVKRYKLNRRFRQSEGITSFNGTDFFLSNEHFRLPLLVNKKQELHRLRL